MSRGEGIKSLIKRPLFLIIIAGLVIRLVLMPLFSHDYDIYHWALVVSDINSGNNLYNLDGYYYTPVWGYLLGFISHVQELFVNIGGLGTRFTSLLPTENMVFPYHIATITTIAFNIIMKVPLILCDCVVGYLVFYLVKDRTGDKKKAVIGFGLWFLCPIVIYMSSVQAMFDTFSALLLLLTIISFYKNKYFFGGMFFSIAVLLKMFPFFCIFVLLAYIIVKNKDSGLVLRKVIEAAAGVLVMFLILMLPVILNGDLGTALSFVSDRVSSNIFSTIFIVVNLVIAVLAAFFFGYKMYRTDPEKADSAMFLYVMLTVAAALLMSVMPQYIIVLIPMLILQIFTSQRAYLRCWVLLGVSAFLATFMCYNYSVFSMLSVYTSFVSPEWVVSSMQFLETGLGIDLVSLLSGIANCVQYISLLLILLFYFIDRIQEKIPILGKILNRIRGKGGMNNEPW